MRQWLIARWQSDRVEVIAAALVGALALFLRVYELGRRSLWLDEILQAECITPDIGYLFDCLRKIPNQSPLPFLINYYWYRLAGSAVLPQPDWFIRVPFVIAGVLAIPFAWHLADDLLGRRAAWIAAVLWSVVPTTIGASQEVHPYAWLLLFSLASAMFLVRALKTGKRSAWIAFGVSTALNVYSHYSAFFFLAGEGFFTLVWLGTRVWKLPRREWVGTMRTPFIGALIGIGVALLLLAPWTNDLERFAEFTRKQSNPFVPLTLTYVGEMMNWLLFGQMDFWDISYASTPLWKIFLLALLALIGLAWLARRTRIGLLLALATLVIPLAYLFSGKGMPATPRYILFTLIPFMLLLTASIDACLEFFVRLLAKFTRPFKFTRAGAILGVLVIVVVAFIPGWVTYYNDGYDDWRGAAEYLRAHAGPRDVILSLGPNASFPPDALGYYLPFPEYSLTFVEADQLNDDAIAGWQGRTGKVWGVIYNQGAFKEAQLATGGAGDFVPVSFSSVTLLAPRAEQDESIATSAGRLLFRYQDLAPNVPDTLLAFLRVQDLQSENLLKSPDFGDIAKGVLINWEVYADSFHVLQENNTPVLAVLSQQVSWGINIIQRMPVIPEQLYVARFDCRNLLTTGTQRVYLTFTTPAGAWLVFPTADGYVCPAGASWSTGTIVFRAPSASDAKPEATLWLRNFGVGTVYFRNVRVMQVAP